MDIRGAVEGTTLREGAGSLDPLSKEQKAFGGYLE